MCLKSMDGGEAIDLEIIGPPSKDKLPPALLNLPVIRTAESAALVQRTHHCLARPLKPMAKNFVNDAH